MDGKSFKPYKWMESHLKFINGWRVIIIISKLYIFRNFKFSPSPSHPLPSTEPVGGLTIGKLFIFGNIPFSVNFNNSKQRKGIESLPQTRIF